MSKPYTEEEVQAAIADIQQFAALRELPEAERDARLAEMERLERRTRCDLEARRILMFVHEHGFSSHSIDRLTDALLEAEERGRKASGG